MSWKFVLNGNRFINYVEASVAAGRAGYKFFLHDNTVYFRDEILSRALDTGLTAEDLM